ncbi:MAG: ParB/RepB/Spo0J family partition protein [Armatimonadota bacterium]|nr:ParB/RepB/Spo0J family partition protein [Armatimonadota bacterium]MDR7469436.1 ParB/RepB/Spo0J family partition protein [Armatimonadota bacterium]MDR7473858.1 ParB/RepB/Spo0J family partition protein [Armatimonadota bacterium]MDR7539083.1 ParB/RepB/Spo0J family partition protein [Armatimonadota bacterium]
MEETRPHWPAMSADARRRGLGRGLGALLGREAFDEGLVRDLSVHEIRPSRLQPRSQVSPEDVEELAASIVDRGVLQPIVVRPADDGYELVAGERRWRAAMAAGLQVVPAIVRNLSDQDALEVALLENIQREDLRPMEKARAYRRLQQEFGMTQDQIAARLRKSQAAIANTLRLLQLPEEVQKSLDEGRITEGHARALLALAAPQAVKDVCLEVERRKLSVRQTEQLVRRWNISRGIRRHPRVVDPNVAAVEAELSAGLQTKVAIRQGRRRGHVLIEFYSPADLDRIVSILLAVTRGADVRERTPEDS